MDLLSYRNELDVIDAQIVHLFEERLEICDKIAKYKEENNLPIYDEKREHEKLLAIENMVDDEHNEALTIELFEKIMELSKIRQKKVLR